MNKGSVAATSNTKPPITTKSAWSKGPPQQQAGQASTLPPAGTSNNTSRSNTPNPSVNATPAHSRRPSAYTPAVAVKGGQPRPTSMSFGTIDLTANSTPSSTPGDAAPAANGVARAATIPTPTSQTSVNFGSINTPASSTPVTSSTSVTPSLPSTTAAITTSSTNPAPTPAPKRKLDPNSLFRGGSAQPSQPSAAPTSGTNQSQAVNSPQQRLAQLPNGPSAAHHSPYYSPQQGAAPSHLRPGPNAGTGPRSSSFSRGQPPAQPQVNGSGARSSGPHGQPNGTTGPANPSGIGSPRLGPQPQLPPMPQQGGPSQPQQQQTHQQQQPQQVPPFPQPIQQPPHQWPGQYAWPPGPYSHSPYGYMVPHEGWGYPPPIQQHHPHLGPHQHHLAQQHPGHMPYGMQPPPSQPAAQPGPTPPIANQQAVLPPTQQHQQQQQQQPPYNSQPSLPPPQQQLQTPVTPVSPRPIPILPAPAPGTPVTTPLITTNLPPSNQNGQSALRTPLQPGAALFVPKKSIRITNPDTKEAVVFRPPDPVTPGAGQTGHGRSVSIGGRTGVDNDPFNPFPTHVNVKKPVKMESPEDKKKREEKEAEEARKKKEAEEDEARKKKEAAELEEKKKREAEEEAERKRLEEEQRVQREKEEEAARIKREKEEAEERERLEKIKKEEEEARLKREKEEEEERERVRIQKEKEEAEAAAAAKAQAEEDARLQEEQEQREKEAREKEEADKAAAAAAAEAESRASPSTPSVSSEVSTPALPTKPTLSPISTTPDNKPRRPVPGPLNLDMTKQQGMLQPLPSALATARIIEDLDKVKYPEGIKTPDVELNQGSMQGGKFKYDRDFLLQFMVVCKDKPDNLPPLDALGIERDEAGGTTFAGTGRYPNRRMPPPMSARSASTTVGLGISNLPQKNNLYGPAGGAGSMGSFQAPSLPSRLTTSEERFVASQRAASVAFPSGAAGGRSHTMARTASQGGVGRMGAMGQDAGPQSPRDPTGRTRSQRGNKRPNQAPAAANAVLQQAAFQQQQMQQMQQGWEPIVPLQPSENRWTPASRTKGSSAAQDEKALVDRKVRSLLNKLTMEKFDSISDQIIDWANKSEHEKDGKTLIQVIKLVFEKATDEATWSEMYAKLCRKMMETISPNVQDEGIRNAEGLPIVGGNLFRKYLLNRCQEDFERGWSAKEAAVAAAASKKEEDDKAAAASAAAKASGAEEEIVLYSEEYYAALKAKRQGLGLVKFIGELFKLQMLTERIMHECIKKLLSNVENPEEEEIESLCKLLSTVGQSLDTIKAKNHMDIYFSRMDVLARNPQVSSRVQYMLLDVIELRHRGWRARQAVAAPSTIAAVHELAAKEKAAAEAAAAHGRTPMSRGGSRRGEHTRGDYGNQPGPDGWNVAPAQRIPAKAGDLSNFGKISKSGGMGTMGPSNVFRKGDKGLVSNGLGLGGPGGRDAPPAGPNAANALARAASSSNMFSLLGGDGADPGLSSMSRSVSARGPPRKPSLDATGAATTGVGPETPMRRKIQLLPRTVGASSLANSSTPSDKLDEEDGDGNDARSEASTATEPTTDLATDSSSMIVPAPQAVAVLDMTDAQAKTKVKEDVKEILAVRNISEAEQCFDVLPVQHKSKLVDALVSQALDAKEDDIRLVSDVFAKVSATVPSESFEDGFAGTVEFVEDIVIDVPQAYPRLAKLMKGAGFGRDAVERLANKIAVEGDPVKHPRDRLLAAFDALA